MIPTIEGSMTILMKFNFTLKTDMSAPVNARPVKRGRKVMTAKRILLKVHHKDEEN